MRGSSKRTKSYRKQNKRYKRQTKKPAVSRGLKPFPFRLLFLQIQRSKFGTRISRQKVAAIQNNCVAGEHFTVYTSPHSRLFAMNLQNQKPKHLHHANSMRPTRKGSCHTVYSMMRLLTLFHLFWLGSTTDHRPHTPTSTPSQYRYILSGRDPSISVYILTPTADFSSLRMPS